MEPNLVRVDCDVCESVRDIAGETIKIVHNLTHNTYDYTYFCVMCGSRQAHPVEPKFLTDLFRRGCEYSSFEMPKLSSHLGGDTINQDDINMFIESLNNHDHLAAYA